MRHAENSTSKTNTRCLNDRHRTSGVPARSDVCVPGLEGGSAYGYKRRGMPNDLKPPTDRIPLPSWIRTPKIVRTEMLGLVRELAEVNRRLEKAEEQLRRNSQNSSQPPSQDKPGQ